MYFAYDNDIYTMTNVTDNKNTKMNFNQVIDSLGTFEKGVDITIFKPKLNNVFQENTISNDIQKKAILLFLVSEETY